MSYPYLRDTQRVELALPAAMMSHLVGEAVKNGGWEIDAQLQDDLRRSLNENWDGIDDRTAIKLANRLDRARANAMASMEKQKRSLATAFAAVWQWLDERLECGDLVLWEGSVFAAVLIAVQDALDDNVERGEDGLTNKQRIDIVWKSAGKCARELHQNLLDAGYFKKREIRHEDAAA